MEGEERGWGVWGGGFGSLGIFLVWGPACFDVCPLLRALRQGWMTPAQLPHPFDIEMNHA